MKDNEFVSELFVVLIDGVQEGQKNLDKFYADYDVNFPRKQHYISKFHQTVNSLRSISELIKDSRFNKKADFYALFAAAAKLNEKEKNPVDLKGAAKELRKLEASLDKNPDQLQGISANYYSSVVEGPNKRAKREDRIDILYSILSA
jgi:hypothetical protein